MRDRPALRALPAGCTAAFPLTNGGQSPRYQFGARALVPWVSADGALIVNVAIGTSRCGPNLQVAIIVVANVRFCEWSRFTDVSLASRSSTLATVTDAGTASAATTRAKSWLANTHYPAWSIWPPLPAHRHMGAGKKVCVANPVTSRGTVRH